MDHYVCQTISKLTEEYCRRIEDLFMDEMFPKQSTELQTSKQYAFFEKAKLSISGEKKVEPFNFTPSVRYSSFEFGLL